MDTGKRIEELMAELDKELYENMKGRIKRLRDRKIWLKGWLRFHKIKREYRKLAKITKYFI